MSSAFSTLLSEKGYLIADGAMGTNLFQRGLETGDCPELWNVDHPDRVKDVHREFLEAGSDLFLTNSFGGTRHRLKLHNAQERAQELNAAAAKIAREAADGYMKETGRKVLVAGSIGPTGELFQPLGALTHEDGVAAFREQAQGLAAGGVDLFWIETMSSSDELSAAVAGVCGLGIPYVCTLTFDTNARTMMGITPEEFAALAQSFEPQPLAFGANCGVGPSELVHSILGISSVAKSANLVAKGNCGIPQYVEGEIVYSGTPEAMADYAKIARDAGATIIGGCCGSTPIHVKAIADSLNGYTPGERPTEARLTEVLGQPWAQAGRLSTHSVSDEGEDGGGRRRGRRRRS